jgi:hypothetical protein
MDLFTVCKLGKKKHPIALHFLFTPSLNALLFIFKLLETTH